MPRFAMDIIANLEQSMYLNRRPHRLPSPPFLCLIFEYWQILRYEMNTGTFLVSAGRGQCICDTFHVGILMDHDVEKEIAGGTERQISKGMTSVINVRCAY